MESSSSSRGRGRGEVEVSGCGTSRGSTIERETDLTYLPTSSFLLPTLPALQPPQDDFGIVRIYRVAVASGSDLPLPHLYLPRFR